MNNAINYISTTAAQCKIWSRKKIVRKSIDAGRELINISRQNQDILSIEDINHVYQKSLPKGTKVEASDDPKKALDFLVKIGHEPENAHEILNSGTAFAISNRYNEHLIYMPINEWGNNVRLKASVHELTHTLAGENSLNAKLIKLIRLYFRTFKIKPNKAKINDISAQIKTAELYHNLYDKIIEHQTSEIIPQNADVQGLVKHLGMQSKKELYTDILNSIETCLDGDTKKKNIEFLKYAKYQLKEEVIAYKVDGQIEKEYLEIEQGSTTDQMVSILFKEATKMLKIEIIAHKLERIFHSFASKNK